MDNLQYKLNTPVTTQQGLLVAKMETRYSIEVYVLYLVNGAKTAATELTCTMSENTIINKLIRTSYKLNK